MLLNFVIDKEGFRCINANEAASATTANYIKCHFDLRKLEHLDAVVAVFKSATYNKHAEILLDSNWNCFVDPEVYRRGGTIQVKLIGDKYISEGVLSTTFITPITEFYIREDIAVPTETPSKYDIFIAELEKAEQAVEDVMSDLALKLANHEFDGPQGDPGTDGDDGFSPLVSFTSISGGNRMTVEDAGGTHSIDIMNGIDGTDGTDGTDGFSPVVEVETISGGHAVTITDADGAHEFNVMDGGVADIPLASTSQAGVVKLISGSPAITTIRGASDFRFPAITSANKIAADLVPEATSTTSGTMSASEKIKLNGIEAGADVTAVTQTLSSGTKIGEVNGTSLYAPNGNIFVATHEETAFDDIEDAVNHGKTVILELSDGTSALLTDFVSNDYAQFTRIEESSSNEFACYSFICNDGEFGSVADSWVTSYNDLVRKYSPALTGTPTAPTAVSGTDTTQIATTAFVHDVVDSIPNVPSGGSSGQVLAKASGTDYDTTWVNQSGGSANVLDGQATGSVRTAGSNQESVSYTLGQYAFTEGNMTEAQGVSAHAEGSGCRANSNFAHAEGNMTSASASSAHSEGTDTLASGIASHAEGMSTKAQGNYSHAEGASTTASGNYSHAEGADTIASGDYSHAEGVNNTAGGDYSHAEGAGTNAISDYSHAEGAYTIAGGAYAHSEGYGTFAQGQASHAEGDYTIASRKAQHVFGEYNVADTSGSTFSDRGDYVEIVGNGTAANARSNARTLDWSGNESLAGSLTLGAGTADEVTITAAQLTRLLALL